jgi:hypothetical protein
MYDQFLHSVLLDNGRLELKGRPFLVSILFALFSACFLASALYTYSQDEPLWVSLGGGVAFILSFFGFLRMRSQQSYCLFDIGRRHIKIIKKSSKFNFIFDGPVEENLFVQMKRIPDTDMVDMYMVEIVFNADEGKSVSFPLSNQAFYEDEANEKLLEWSRALQVQELKR